MAKQIDGTEFACLTINADLEAENEKLKKQLALYEQSNKVLNDQLNKATEHLSELNDQLAEKEKELECAIVLKPDKYVIVTNGWKKQGYGIAKIHQEVQDVYYYCSNNRIGSFSPLTQYGEFETFEEAEVKLKELKGKKK